MWTTAPTLHLQPTLMLRITVSDEDKTLLKTPKSCICPLSIGGPKNGKTKTVGEQGKVETEVDLFSLKAFVMRDEHIIITPPHSLFCALRSGLFKRRSHYRFQLKKKMGKNADVRHRMYAGH